MHRNHHHARVLAGFVAVALIAASCGGDSDSADTTATQATTAPAATEPAETAAPDETEPDETEPAGTEPADAEPAGTEPGDTEAPSDGEGFAALAPPTGETLLIGMVNTEGAAGLDFPEMRTDADLAVDYLNQHGGIGGRPVELIHCAAAGSPETSQACAQELSGKGVEMVMLGLDLFPGYDTFTASDIPVVGVLPILPGDYTANALFLGGGNATTMAAMVALAEQHFEAESVGIISADNTGANSSEAALKAALEKAGITFVSVKGGDNETDAGYQGLIREANAGDPDVLISLYADAGCIGTIRGRAALGITTPGITTPICASSEVIDVVGDEAVGWNFVAIGSSEDTPATADLEAIIEPVHGTDGAGSLGLGALGINGLMTLALIGNTIAAEGGEVTGRSIYDRLATSTDLVNFPEGNPLTCGAAPAYPTICSFVFPIGEYVEGGEVRTIPGFEAISVVDYLP